MKEQPLELTDIQSFIIGAHGKLRSASYVALEITDPAQCINWLKELTERLGIASDGPPTDNGRINVAFSYSGFKRLGLPHQALAGFSREFQEGMWDNRRRQRILGDTGGSHPDRWRWGGPRTTPVDVLLLLFSPNAEAHETLLKREAESWDQGGLRIIKRVDGSDLGMPKEHFGFRDGISQPKLAGITSSKNEAEIVSDGEFILGYPNGYSQYTNRPMLSPVQDPNNVLPDDVVGGGLKDFGRNGSYLVVRQLEQDVSGFWSYMDAQSSNAEERERLAAKTMGRWRSGASLVLAEGKDNDEFARKNDFMYHREDPDGLKCPVGSHVRRTNPRDSLAPKPGSRGSIEVNKRHRLLRRGRTYGPALAPSLDPDDFLDKNAVVDPDAQRGLFFMCFNGNLTRQFEFVQGTWINGPNFGGLTGEADPIMSGDHRSFSIPCSPVRQQLTGMPRFVQMVGGGYFFMPGLKALTYLSQRPDQVTSAQGAPLPQASATPVPFSLRVMRMVDRGIQGGRAVFRRQPFASLRNGFDWAFRELIVGITQFLINVRRKDAGLAVAEERLLPREEELASRITGQMSQFLLNHYRNSTAERAGNTKTYGLLRAEFVVKTDVPKELAVGVFQPGATFRSYVRLGGPGPLVTPDIRNNGILSIGVKLMGVKGERLLDDESATQDFTGISSPTFTTPNALENLKLQRHIGQGTSVFYFLNPFDSHYLDGIMQGAFSKSHASPLDLSYWSCVPYKLGDGRAMQYRFVPGSHRRSKVPWRPSDDYLRDAMVDLLAKRDVEFEFQVQLQTDPHRMPIENASVIWPERLSPWITLAVLRIPAQEFDSPDQLAFARHVSFNPWNGITEHQPLGNQNRVRKLVYLETSKLRQRMNKESRVEPTGEEVFGG